MGDRHTEIIAGLTCTDSGRAARPPLLPLQPRLQDRTGLQKIACPANGALWPQISKMHLSLRLSVCVWEPASAGWSS